MKKSLTQLGKQFGLNGQEMHQLMKAKGLLSGEPNNWSVTEKGKPYVNQNLYFAGSSRQSGEWTVLSWDEEVLNGLDVSEDDINTARNATKEARRKAKKEKEECEKEWQRNETQVREEHEKAEKDFETAEKIGIGLIGATVVVYSGYKLWQNRNRIKLWFKRIKIEYFPKK